MRHIRLILSYVSIAFLCAPLFAQPVYSTADTTLLPEIYLEEVQIVAMRESGRIGKLPLSAAVLDQELLKRQQINTLNAAGTIVPNVFMPDYGSRLTSPVYIRGVGSRINAPSVGLYVDNVPFFEKSTFEFDLLNTDRIEVLRGPQGTLYGRNTMGGLINVYSISPLAHEGTHLLFTVGNKAYVNAGASHYQRLSGKAGLAVSAGLNRHDGFFENTHVGENADRHLSAGGRLRLAWQLSPALMMEWTMHGEYLDQGGYPYAVHDYESDNTMDVQYDRPSSYKRNMGSNGLLFRYSAPNFMIQSVTALQYVADKQSIDQDFTPADLVFAVQEQDHLMISQEFTARSHVGESYEWVFGLFGFSQRVDHDLDVAFGSDAVSMGIVPGLMSRGQQSITRIKGAAVYHQSTVHGIFTEDLSLTAGLRLDYEQASLDHEEGLYAAFPVPPASAFSSDLSFYELLPRLAVVYQLPSSGSIFLSVTRGYKTGGFNTVFEREEDRSFQPEYSWNYEFGTKLRMLNGRFSLQTALFYIDWKNQQLYQMLPSGQGSMLGNAGASVSKGFEFELAGKPVESLSFTLNYGYTHATFTDNEPRPGTDLSGNFIPYVPSHTLFCHLAYDFSWETDWLKNPSAGVSYLGLGKHYWNDTNTAYQDQYGTLQAMLAASIRELQVRLWARNLTNTSYHAFSFAALNNHYVQPGRPLTFGMDVRYNF
jgi:iron complex outermembrane recepter protein